MSLKETVIRQHGYQHDSISRLTSGLDVDISAGKFPPRLTTYSRHSEPRAEPGCAGLEILRRRFDRLHGWLSDTNPTFLRVAF